MRHDELLNTLYNLTGRMFKQRELAEAINKRISVIGQRACRNSDYPLEDLIKISNYAGVDLINNSKISDIGKISLSLEEQNITDGTKETIDCPLEEIKEETKEKYVVIHYWDGCVDCKEKIINPYFSELMLDMQKIINVYGANPENLAIISMLGDEMDGGTFPIKNNDILVIDTSINDLSSTGIYFCISDNGLFVRRLAQLIGDDSIYISVDNPLYADVLNKTLSNDQLNSMGFKVIGKVIGNESLSCRV